MYQNLEQIYSRINRVEDKNIDYKYLENYILDLFNKNIICDSQDANISFWNGLYYQRKKNYELMKKYYLMAIDLNYGISLKNLGNYYTLNDNIVNFYYSLSSLW